jgi:hypothetical protein
MGVLGWAGLRNFVWSQFWESGILFDRLVTISEKEHQVGGFGDPPNVSQRAMQATLAKTMMDWTAAKRMGDLAAGIGAVALDNEHEKKGMCQSEGYDKVDDLREASPVDHFSADIQVNPIVC